MEISNDEFDRFVCQAIESIDEQFRIYLDEVPVVVEDLPDEAVCRLLNLADRHSLLGLFQGYPLNKRSVRGASGPNQIVLYRKNILAFCRSRRRLAGRIRKTLIHELGHYLGFTDPQLRHHHH